jgi:hypothetical protein
MEVGGYGRQGGGVGEPNGGGYGGGGGLRIAGGHMRVGRTVVAVKKAGRMRGFRGAGRIGGGSAGWVV